jgi:hypothetical protein
VSNTTKERELKRKVRTYSKNYSVAESTANDIKEENNGNDSEQNKRKRGKNQVQRRRNLGFESDFQEFNFFYLL